MLELYKLKYCIALFYLLFNATQANSKSDPFLLPFPLILTASPGEFRGPHLHAGIDLSTKQTTGWPVYAIEDGVVLRIKSKYRSEGRAVYLKHLDGRVSVYAHLEDYSPAIQSLAPKKRYFDIFPKTKLTVRKGKLLGYSGESGAGLPHLHFEIRKNMGRSSRDSIILTHFKEKLAPIIEKIHFVQPETGEVRFSVSSQQLNRSNGKPFVFIEPLTIAVQMYDRVKSDYARCNVPYSLLRNNDKVIFEAHMDEVRFPRDYHSSMHYLTEFTSFGPTRFSYKMYRDYPQNSPFIKQHIDNGWINAGDYNLQLEAWDYFGNRSIQSIPIRVLRQHIPKPKPEWMELGSSKKFVLQSGPARLVFNTKFSSRLDEVKLEWRNEGSPQIRIGPPGLFFTKPAKLILPINKGHYWANLSGPIVFKRKAKNIQIDLSGAQYLSLLPDNQKPWISKTIRTLSGRRKVRHYIRAGDKSSGLDNRSIQAFCADNARDIEWDVDRRWLWISNPCQNMKVSLCDKVGLCNSQTVNFANKRKRYD